MKFRLATSKLVANGTQRSVASAYVVQALKLACFVANVWSGE